MHPRQAPIFGLGLLCFLAAGTSFAQAPPTLDDARTLLKAGKADEALRAVRDFRKGLPADQKLARWRIDFPHKWTCRAAMIGKRHVYFVTSRSGGKLPLGLVDKRPVLSDADDKYDSNEVVSCVDGISGKILWTRQTAGHMHLHVDPVTDGLYVWRDRWPSGPGKVLRLKAADGDIDFEKPLPRNDERIEGLIIQGRQFHHTPDYPRRGEGAPVLFYNFGSEKLERLDPRAAALLSPDEKHRLTTSLRVGPDSQRTIALQDLAGKNTVWRYELPVYSLHDPIWHDGDVIAINGTDTSRAEVIRLDGATGKLMWRYAMPRGAFRDKLRGSGRVYSYQGEWEPVGVAGNHIIAIGGDGDVHLLDPKTGKRAALLNYPEHHETFPRVIDKHLVLCTLSDIRAVPLAMILDGKANNERDAVVLEAEILANSGKLTAALGMLRDMLRQYPGYRPGWKLKAELAGKAELRFEEAGALCTLMEIEGRDADPVLRDRYGLVKHIATGNLISHASALLEQSYYVGTHAGWLYEIDTRTGAVLEKTEHPHAILGVNTVSRLKAIFDTYKEKTLKDDDGWNDPPSPPDAWNKDITGYTGMTVRYKGKYFRPLMDGHVRVLYKGQVSDYLTSLKGIQSWDIYLGPRGPLGYGDKGVFELDENLRPVRILIKAPKNWQRDWGASFLASDGETLCIHTYDGERSLLQIWSGDGKKLLRQQPLFNCRLDRNPRSRLVAAGQGYLFAGDEIICLPTNKEQPARRFAPQFVGEDEKKGSYWWENARFGVPVLADNHLLVTHRGGGIYVFDVRRLTRP